MKNITKFDLGMIIAFAVVGLIGGGVWYFLSGQLDEAMTKAAAAQQTFKRQSTSDGIVVTKANQKTLQDNIDLYQGLINPLIQDKFFAKGNVFPAIDKQDSVSWKHDLNERISSLKAAAKDQGVVLPDKFYFAFSRYAGGSPDDSQTVVLSKQLAAIEQISSILIKAPIKSIKTIKRTFEEEPHTAGQASGGANADPDRVGGYATTISDSYIDYPYEVEFDTSVEGLRKVLDNLLQCPYVFVVRSITIVNDKVSSPQIGDLEKIAGPPPESMTESIPGATAQNSARSPIYLFSNTLVHVKMRVDLIEWKSRP